MNDDSQESDTGPDFMIGHIDCER